MDVWSAGCIFAELIIQNAEKIPLFKADNDNKLLQKILEMNGMPDPHFMQRVVSEHTRTIITGHVEELDKRGMLSADWLSENVKPSTWAFGDKKTARFTCKSMLSIFTL